MSHFPSSYHLPAKTDLADHVDEDASRTSAKRDSSSENLGSRCPSAARKIDRIPDAASSQTRELETSAATSDTGIASVRENQVLDVGP